MLKYSLVVTNVIRRKRNSVKLFVHVCLNFTLFSIAHIFYSH